MHASDQTRSVGGPHAVVTGGAGFIGSHLTEHLLARGDTVWVIDNLSTGRDANLDDARAAAGDRLRVINADVARGLEQIPPGAPIAEVYHLAAAVGVDLVLREPIESIEVNIGRTLDVLRFAQARGNLPTLIASSSEVYGKPGTTVFSEDDDVVYGPTTVTRWSYAATKAIDEYLALAFCNQRDLPAVVVRFFNTVGPRQVGDYGMVLPRFVRSALAGEPLRVFGDGQQTRCFCDVRDVRDALPKLLARPECAGRVFNLGSDLETTIADLAETVVTTLESPSSIDRVPYADAYPAGFEDLRHRRPDLRRVREAIGFEPRVTLDQTVRDIARTIRAERPGASPSPSGASGATGGNA
ncbi:MAG: NAD-dependent epimerase/dehydratase family protein [Planctomycetota bacterium]